MRFPICRKVWDEPFADPSMLPSLLLCRAARRELTVCLAGDGGDEIFAGYNRHALGSSLWSKVGWMPGPIRSGLGRMLLAPSPASIDRVGASIGRCLPERFRVPNLGDKVQKAATVMRAGRCRSVEQPRSDLARRSRAWRKRRCGVLHTDERARTHRADDVTDTAVVLPDQMLVKVDRASMAASLEVRSPFLDHRLLEWSWRQPLEVKTKGGVGKLVLREVLNGLVPPSIVDRPKMGFDPPLAIWLRGPLRGWASDLVDSSTSVANGWLDGTALRRTWNEHQSGARNYDYRLWAVLMLESWLAEYG